MAILQRSSGRHVTTLYYVEALRVCTAKSNPVGPTSTHLPPSGDSSSHSVCSVQLNQRLYFFRSGCITPVPGISHSSDGWP